MKTKNNRLLFMLFWAAMILIFAYAWVPGGLDGDSCNYALVAKEILRTHKWLGLYDPVWQGVFYYHFPLCIWVTAGLFKFFGVSTFTAKLFSMLSAVVLVGVIFCFGRLLKNHWVGFFAGLSLLLTNHIVRLSRQCRMDLPVSLFISLAILSFILSQRRSRLYYLLYGLFTCLAIFTKDISGLFPLAIVFVYLAIRWKWKEFFHPLFISGLLAAIGPVFFWLWLDQRTLFNAWFHWNFLHLFKSPSFTVPWYYYIWAVATKYFYFLPFAIYGGYLAIKEARASKNYEFYLLLIWAVIFPLAFSFGRQKIHYFILPIYPAASLLVGLACDKIFRETTKLKIATGLKYILIIASIVMLCFPLNIQSKRAVEIVRIAAFIDQILKQLPEYEFILYNQGRSEMLFYSQQLKDASSISDMASLEDVLNTPGTKPRLCYLSEEDFVKLKPTTRQNCSIVLKYRGRVFIVNQKEPAFVVTLP